MSNPSVSERIGVNPCYEYDDGYSPYPTFEECVQMFLHPKKTYAHTPEFFDKKERKAKLAKQKDELKREQTKAKIARIKEIQKNRHIPP